MSLSNFYQSKGVRGRNTVSIALAMAGLAIVNIWSLLWFMSKLFERGLRGSPLLTAVPLVGIMLAIFFVELGFVTYVEGRVRRDPDFAAMAQSARPAIWIWYSVVSCALLAGSAAVLVL